MEQVVIRFPDNNVAERRYIIDVIFKDFLGLDYQFQIIDGIENYEIQIGESYLIIEDHFFNSYPQDLSYLSFDNIPKDIAFLGTQLGQDVPIIFGRDYLEVKNNTISCGLDLFASSFFMLTRWEEFVLKNKNQYGRCDEKDLLIIRMGLHKRPIVNEYCELLKKLLIETGYTKGLRRHKFRVLLTHDVDRCYLSSAPEFFKNLGKMLRLKTYKKAYLTFIRYMAYRIMGTNPFDTFEEIMNISEKYGFSASFFFKACEPNEPGFTYDIRDPFVQEALSKIQSRGHQIGFHPSENTINNHAQFKKELNLLRAATNSPIVGGRNHGLYYNENTYRSWEEEHIQYDSGYGFQFENGFRCGTCYSFKTFDVYKREKLELIEIPFIAMDTVSIRKSQTPAEMVEDVKKMIKTVKKYNGIACLNWHSNLLNTMERRNYKKAYFEIIRFLNEINHSRSADKSAN